MTAVQFLTLDEVLALHERLFQEFGGTSGVRDLGLLESALYRPRSGYYEDKWVVALSGNLSGCSIDSIVRSTSSSGQ